MKCAHGHRPRGRRTSRDAPCGVERLISRYQVVVGVLLLTLHGTQGTFITLYSGELITVKEEELRGTTYEAARLNYLLDLDSHLTRLKCHVEPYDRALAEKHGEAWMRAEKAQVEAMNEGDEDRESERCDSAAPC